MRGLNVTAVGYSSEETSIQYKLGQKFQDIWINPKTGKTPNLTITKGQTDDQIYNKIEKNMSAPGRYHIGINPKNGAEHLISFEKTENGESLYYDTQNGELLNIKSYKGIKYVELLKVDKLLFRKDYLEKILEII